MAANNYIRLESIDLSKHPELNERWVQERIAEDPTILGLGDIVLKDKERIQPHAGRLDLLLQDPDDDRRYEVEIQLGKADEAHIIRTIEYWDIERKRYPQYDHCAVIVAENITSRFLNVINLFNGTIPLIAIQMKAYKVAEQITLVFTTIVDELVRGLEEEDSAMEVTDRSYWEKRGTKDTLSLTDDLHKTIQSFAPGYDLKYNKFYIGLAKNDHPNNFVVFRPRKGTVNIDLKLPQSSETDAKIEEAQLDLLDYDKKWGKYRIRLTNEDFAKHKPLIQNLLQSAWDGTSA